MKNFVRTALCAVLLIATSSLTPLMVAPSLANNSAEAVVDIYMNGLFAGDIETIKQCIGKDLKKRHKNTFKDPAYSRFLMNRYDGATFRIIQKKERENGTKIVDVRITFRDNNSMAIRLILDQGNKILNEIIL
jgi:hypothetical protein